MCKNTSDSSSFMEEHGGCILEDKLQPFLLTFAAHVGFMPAKVMDGGKLWLSG